MCTTRSLRFASGASFVSERCSRVPATQWSCLYSTAACQGHKARTLVAVSVPLSSFFATKPHGNGTILILLQGKGQRSQPPILILHAFFALIVWLITLLIFRYIGVDRAIAFLAQLTGVDENELLNCVDMVTAPLTLQELHAQTLQAESSLRNPAAGGKGRGSVPLLFLCLCVFCSHER